MTKPKGDYLIKESDVETCNMLSPLLHSLLEEMKELSKKKQDGVLNKLKAVMINKILKQVKDLLAREPTAQFIDLLDEETLPTNSDAVLILSQFKTAMHQFDGKYNRKDPGESWSRWHTEENP